MTKEDLDFTEKLGENLIGSKILDSKITASKPTAMSTETTNGDWHKSLQLTFDDRADNWKWQQDVEAEVELSRLIEQASPAFGLPGTNIIHELRVSSGNSRPVEEAEEFRKSLA